MCVCGCVCLPVCVCVCVCKKEKGEWLWRNDVVTSSGRIQGDVTFTYFQDGGYLSDATLRKAKWLLVTDLNKGDL